MSSRGWSDLPHHEIPNHDGLAEIAGYRFIGDVWHDVENGAPQLEGQPESYLSSIETFTYHYQNPYGDDVYFQVTGPFDDWDDVWEAIADSLDRYGIA